MSRTAAADPERMRAYSSRTVPQDDAVRETAAAISEALSRARAADTGGFLDRVPDLGPEVRSLGLTLRHLDAWVATVGDAFAAADAGHGTLHLSTDPDVPALLSATQLDRRFADGEDLAAEVLALLEDDIAASYDGLALLLAHLDGADDATLAGFFGSMDAERFHELLWRIHEAHERSSPLSHDVDTRWAERSPTQDLLEPLGLAFAEAGRLGLLSGPFLTDLVRGAPPIDPSPVGRDAFRWPPPPDVLVAQLLIHGDPMGQGDPVLTARLAEIVLAPGFLQRMRHTLGDLHSPWNDGDPDLPQGLFHAELQFHRALGHLAASPEASHLFAVHPPNQTALLDHATQGLGPLDASWGDQVHTRIAAILEQGLLTHPAELGHFDGRLPAVTHDALVHLVGDVAARDRIPATLAPALAGLLLPHLDTAAQAATHGSRSAARHPRPATLDLGADPTGTLRAYLARVVRHDAGLEAVTAVTAAWSQAQLLEHADGLLVDGPVGSHLDTAWLESSQVTAHLHALVGDALADAGADRERQLRYLSLVLGETSSQVRSRALSAAGVAGGPKGFLAAQALRWTDRQLTPRIEDALVPPVTGGDTYRDALERSMPALSAVSLLSYAERWAAQDPHLSFEDLVPVRPGEQTVSFPQEPGFFDFLPRVATDDVQRSVGIEEWPRDLVVGWVNENREAQGIPTDRYTEDDWWLARVISQEGALQTGSFGGGS